MKKNILIIICSVLVGCFLSNVLFKEYDYTSKIKTVFTSGDKVYFLQQGVYSSLDTMKENMMSFKYYIYSYENDKYYTYIGITGLEDNLTKLKGYYKEKGYDIYVKELNVNNNEFLDLLNKYDNLLSSTNDNDAIDAIMMQLLGTYEEMIINAS